MHLGCDKMDINLDTASVVKIAREFINFQASLLNAWSDLNPNAHDLECLTDFPKQCTIFMSERLWTASRHGEGVRFVRDDGLSVDVAFAVYEIHSCEANRLFDFLKSREAIQCSGSLCDRERFYCAFDDAVREGGFVVTHDRNGRTLYGLGDRCH